MANRGASRTTGWKDYVQIMKKIFEREGPVTHDGPEYQLPFTGEGSIGLGKPLTSILHTNPDLPIWLGAGSPGTIRLCAELCDGWFPMHFTPKRMAEWMPLVEEGFARAGGNKSLDDYEIQPMATVLVTDDVHRALDAQKPGIALYAGGMGHKDVNFHNDHMIARGYGDAAARIQELFLAGRKREAAEAVPDEYIDEGCLVGPPDRIRSRFVRLGRVGHHGPDHHLEPDRRRRADGRRCRAGARRLTGRAVGGGGGSMPELPDVVVYLEALDRHVVGHRIESIKVAGISLLATYDPPISEAEAKTVLGTRRLGKRLVLELDDDLFLVIHLMIAGRLRWRDPGARPPKRDGLAAIGFEHGTLVLTEAAKKKRASMWLHRGIDAVLAEHDRGGAEPLEIDRDTFASELTARNRTLKRALTDPSAFSGIGNAYSDEILRAAGLSPVKRTGQLDDDELTRLYDATQATLREWLDRLRDEVGEGFPEKVTAFRPEMVVHGKFGEPCAVCGTEVQRIVYAENEVNYCPSCQTGGKVLADRSLSRILKDDWPRTIEELEGVRGS